MPFVCSLNKPPYETEDVIKSIAVIPYHGTVTQLPVKVVVSQRHINSRVLAQILIKIFVEDPLGLRVTAVYKIPCTCGLYYIGQTDRKNTSIIRLGCTEKSALVGHGWKTGHNRI